MGIFAGNRQPKGSATVGTTSGNEIFYEYNTSVYYIVGTTDLGVAGGTDAFVAKYNANGILQWQRTIGGSGTETGRGVYADTSGNVYIVGSTTSSGQGGSDVLIVKYDTNGTLLWQRTWGTTGTDIGYGIYVDATYVLITGSTGDDAFLLYYNTSGTLQWQRLLYSAYTDVGTTVTFDGAYARFVVCGNTKAISTGGVYNMFIVSFDTAGSQQWQQNFSTGTESTISRIIYNPSDNYMYFTGKHTGSLYAHVTKIYGNSGIQWSRLIYGGTMSGIGLSWDRFSNIYFTGASSSNSYFIAKYSSAGTFIWQNTLSGLPVNDIWVDYNTSGIANREVFYIVGGNSSATTIKLPQDGTNTGTYSNYTYTSGGLLNTTANLSNSGSSLTISTPTLTSATSTLTSSTSTLSSVYNTSGSYYTTTLSGNTSGVTSITTSGQYTVHTFTGSASFVAQSNGFVDVLSIGAGGDCGAPGPGPSGGGGAGAVILKKFTPVTSGTAYLVSVGITTINGAGGNTIFNAPGVGVASITAFGGGAGGPGSSGGIAGSSPNASGGGASPAPSTAGVGFGASTFGYPGGNASPTHAGGGGGAGSIGGDSPGSAPGLGGSGVPIAYFTGISTNIVSAGGGPGITTSNYGNGGQSSTPGTSQPGVLYIRYI